MIRIIISGGGTGGHVFPAIAIADALKKRVPDAEILFVGALGRLEMEKVPGAGYRIEGLTISGFQRRMTWKNLGFPFKLLGSLIKSRSIIRKFKPDGVIGVGGYASGPTLRMAVSLGIPALIQEQNSYPGITNRLLGKKVQKICVAYDGMERFFPKEKIVLTGNPIRRDLIHLEGKSKEAYAHFGLKEDKKVVLVIGGSLGAGNINRAIKAFMDSDSGNSEFQLLWQTGKYYYEDYKLPIPFSGHPDVGHRVHAAILPFIDRMDLAYAAADIVISRAGAIAISELCVVGKPVILIPSPNVAEDHQTKNALALSEKKSAILVRDAEAVEKLGKTLIALLNNAEMQAELSLQIRKLATPDAAEKIATEALKLKKDES